MNFTKGFWKRQGDFYHKRAVARFNKAKATYPRRPWPDAVRDAIRADLACMFYARAKQGVI